MNMPSEDVAIIRSDGIPAGIDPRFVIPDSGRKVRFTNRGREFYRLAMIIYGLDPDLVEHVRTRKDLREISLMVASARLAITAAETERELHAGRIKAPSRGIVSALLYGTLEEFRAAVDHGSMCNAAGSNVIPLPRRRPARR